jgi:hypothetical protein
MAIDSYRFLDFATRQIIKARADREAQGKRDIPWTPMAKPLSESTVALITTAGVARNDDVPFDQEGERQNLWWGDPTYRTIPQGTTEGEGMYVEGRVAPTCYNRNGLSVLVLFENKKARRFVGARHEGVAR